jgi:hypothetical protein
VSTLHAPVARADDDFLLNSRREREPDRLGRGGPDTDRRDDEGRLMVLIRRSGMQVSSVPEYALEPELSGEIRTGHLHRLVHAVSRLDRCPRSRGTVGHTNHARQCQPHLVDRASQGDWGAGRCQRASQQQRRHRRGTALGSHVHSFRTCGADR